MMLSLCRVGALLLVVGVFGCEQPVKWSFKQEMDPDPLKIGKKATAYCTVTGDLEKVGWLTAAPIVAPEFAVELRDEGTKGDKKAGDGIFTTSDTVPAEVEPGMYEIEVIAYDKNGDILRVPSLTILDKDGKVIREVTPKAGEGDKAEKTVEACSIIEVNLEE
jgi:hypothetical protein